MGLLYAYYGDDFTGSTDVLEQLASNGVETVLFLGVPTAEQLASFPEVRAIGVAGDSRSRSPEWMSAHLPTIFRWLKTYDAQVTHYKVCSTFDSSPRHGSIGRAIELGRQVFGGGLVPVVVGAPHLRRYVAFGTLFAAAPHGEIVRIDRHPMSRHPVTPMLEADLRVHLGGQTKLGVGLVDLTQLWAGNAAAAVDAEIARGIDVVLFDTIDATTQALVGKLVWREAERRALFSASSSGLTAALISAWRNQGMIPAETVDVPIVQVEALLVVSGSCSAVTERQIRWALDRGYVGIAVAPDDLRDPTGLLQAASTALAAGRNAVIYTALGVATEPGYADSLGIALGRILRELLDRTGVRRVLLCGGDTSSHAVQQLGLYALTWVANLQAGAPLCRAHGDSGLDGLELVLKGGQVGSDDFFEVVRGVR